MFNNKFMIAAIEQAHLAQELGEVPIGCAIVKNGEIIARAHNEVILQKDPSAHAEVLAIRGAAKVLRNERLQDCDLYVTLEPCPMCAQVISFARIRRLYYAAADIKGGGVEHGAQIFNCSSCHHKPEVYSGIMEQEAKSLLQNFFSSKR